MLSIRVFRGFIQGPGLVFLQLKLTRGGAREVENQTLHWTTVCPSHREQAGGTQASTETARGRLYISVNKESSALPVQPGKGGVLGSRNLLAEGQGTSNHHPLGVST